MNFVVADFKFAGMRKSQEFIIYPCKATDELVTLQSDTRIARVNLTTGAMLISAPKSGGAFMHHLNAAMKATTITLNDIELAKVKQMRDKMAGKTNEDGSVTIVGGK